YLDGKTPAMQGKSERERCIAAIGADTVKQAVEISEAERQTAVMAQLIEDGVEVKRIAFRNGSKEKLQGHIGAPGFRFVLDVGE
ncbi:MAG: hypothetical protein WBG34_01515, partial [Flavobacteriales bacterium]